MTGELKVVKAEKIGYNFDEWNPMQNTYNLKVFDTDIKYPKSLLKEAWKWFQEQAKGLHIDTSFFKYVRITYDDPTWQVDFFENEELEGNSFVFYNIYLDGRNRKILQAEFGIGR